MWLLVLLLASSLLSGIHCNFTKYRSGIKDPAVGTRFLIGDFELSFVLGIVDRSTADGALVDWDDMGSRDNTLWVKTKERHITNPADGRLLCAVPNKSPGPDDYSHVLRVFRKPTGCCLWSFRRFQILCDAWEVRFWNDRHKHLVLIPI